MHRKDNDDINNDLFEFIDSIGSEVNNNKNNNKKHMVIFYEESKSARNVEFRFIKNGLLKNEHCIYTVAEEENKEDVISFIEREMSDYGIDVDKYKNKNNLLHIYHTPYTLHIYEDIIKKRETILNTLLAGLKPPFRITNMLVPESKTREQIRANIEIERKIHRDFNNNQFPGSLMCSYSIKNIINDITGNWMRNMLLNHHTAIFLPKLSNGLVLNLLS
jgi:hypothetical protein